MTISRSHFFIFIVYCFFTKTTASLAGTIDTNIREQCRARVSGLYLSTWNKLSNAQGLLELAKKNQLETIDAISAEEKKLEKILKSEAHQAFDYKSAEKENTARILIKSLKQSLSQQKKLVKQNKENYAETKKEEESLKKNIRKVFSIERVGVGKNAKSFQIEYLKPCPKYRFVCPLERKDAQMLIEIFENGEIPTPCQKYSGHFDN